MRHRFACGGRRSNRPTPLTWGLALLGGLLLPALAVGHADEPLRIFEWTDEQGVVRYTPHLDRIPHKLLTTVIVMERGEDVRAFAYIGSVDGQPVLRSEPPMDGPVRKVVVMGPAPLEARVAPLEVDAEPFEVEAAPLDPESPAASPAPPVGGAPAPTGGPGPGEDRCSAARIAERARWLSPLERLELLQAHRLYGTRVEVDGHVWQRLRLGFFPSLTAARSVQSRLEPSFPGAWIVPVSEAERQASETTALTQASGEALSAPGAASYAIQLGALPLRDCIPQGEQLTFRSTSD
jgi:hypothetical protein